jgi:GTP pyrophosphokinase
VAKSKLDGREMVSSTNSFSISKLDDIQKEIKDWIKRITTNRSKTETKAIIDACAWAQQIQQSQTNMTGEPYVIHVITVADILAQLGMDTNVLVATILHDVILDKQFTLYDIEKHFGTKVMRLVDGISKMKLIEELNDRSYKNHNNDNQTERLRKMLLAMAEDVRVVIIKLADRLQNMRLLPSLPESKQQRIASETLDLFAPLANRLGIWQIKWELEDLSLRYLEPDVYQTMKHLIDERRIDREKYIQQLMTELKAALNEAGIRADISGRPKHIYSIWRKMQRKGLDFQKIFDVRAVRVLVNTVNECYTALGIVHNRWQPLPGEFDDYIANPKNNNYQSLHTSVIGPQRKIFEVQIRTHTMHHHAELGVASHWRYKEQGSQHDKGFEEKIAWLRKMLQCKDEEADAGDLFDRFKSEIFEDRVYVLSPKGQVIDLPQEATPLDFAYYIHTELGHRCRGAKINNRIVPLTHTLKNGDLVEILTSKEKKPSRDWLIPQAGYLKTSRARSKVRQWLKKQDNQNHHNDGRVLLERILRRLNIKCNFEQLGQRLHFKSLDEFLVSVGKGDTTASQIAGALQNQLTPKKTSNIPKNTNRTPGEVYIKGVGGLFIQTAGCCKPVPNDSIVGYISKGRGVVVHRRDCPNALRWQDEGNQRLIEVEWDYPEEQQTAVYSVDIEISAFDRPGLLRDIYTITADKKLNILATHTRTNKADNTVQMMLTLEVSNMAQLSQVLSEIDNLTNVMKVWRKT